MVRVTEKAASLQRIASDVRQIKERVIEKIPEHFSAKHLLTAFFGALLMGLTFVLKGLVLRVAAVLTATHIILILATTFILLTSEIYFIGYSRVKKKALRPFGQFWLKRMVAYYAISVIVSFFLVFIYHVDALAAANTLKLVVAVSLPCAIGASFADLLEKY